MNDSTPPAARYNHTRRIVAILLLVAFAVFVAWGLYMASRPAPDQLQGMIDTDQVNVATQVLSRVDKLLVQEGDHVEAGQTLALLSNPEVDARLAQAQASLAGAQALEARTDAGTRSQDVASLKAHWQAAESRAQLAALTAKRMDNLYAEGVIPAQRRDNADAARTSSAEAAEAAHQQYLKALAGARAEDKRMAASKVASAEAMVQGAQAMYDETRLVAPVSGEVDKRFANAGEIVFSGVPVFTLIDLHDLWVSVNVREDEFQGVGMGKVIKGSIPALGLHDVPFKISYISPQGDFATWRSTRQSSGYDVKSFEVRARPMEAVKGLRPGMSVLFPWPQK